ncbi:MAG: hypothetical protein AAF410_00390 [Pseudomonadota bacterium]
MISSLKSRSDFFNARAINISADKLSVYHWERGSLVSSYLFDVDEAGQENFKKYLSEAANTPLYVLVDLIEEEFRQDSIPHVFGADKDALIKRKQSRLFRDSGFQHAEFQERDEEGRRDDNYLFMALTKNDLLEPWLELLDEHKVPIKAVLSLPQLLQTFLKRLPDVSDYALLVSMQSISGLRQSFFLNKKLKLSRLSKLPRFGTESYAPRISAEIEKIQRYVNSLRLIPNDKRLDIYIQADRKTLDEFQSKRPSLPNVTYHYLDINELAGSFNLQIEKGFPFSDQLFISHLLEQGAVNYYAKPKNLRYSKMRNTRIAMNLCSILLFLGGVVFSGYSVMNGLIYKQQAEDAKVKTDFYQGRYNLARERLPETVVDSYKVKTAVDAAGTLGDYKSTPYNSLVIIGKTLQLFPEIKLDDINWAYSVSPVINNDSNNVATRVIPASQNTEDENYKYFHISTLNAHIDAFDGDFRKAIATVNSFAERLKQVDSVYDVTVTSMPLDISSNATLQGAAGASQKEALFSLQAVIGIN